ncbi:MAG: DUF4240 domain-containing protein [Clostridium sp.]|uniref:DUF4240 domain-containing protein n=1 Tax=Paraclostridium bifermentans TaxID=1490 RepID=UPI00374E493C
MFEQKEEILDEKEFWNIISMFEWKYSDDDERVLKKAIDYLHKKSNEDIYRFYEILSKLLYDLDGIDYAKNIGECSYVDENTYFCPDEFLYSRCVVVANGKDCYYEILKNPIKMIKDMEFESLLYIAEDAYKMKGNEEFDYVPKYDFETFNNTDKW